jgi:hypothetical protein
MRAYKSVFENPKWTTNVLLGGVCQLVPVLGPIVWMGYLYEGVQLMHRQQRDVLPDFDTKRLMPYLMRGLWVFLVNLIPGLVMVPVVFIVYILVFVLAAASKDATVTILGMLCVIPFVVAVQAALALITVPLSIRAGLTQDFMASFNLPFIRDFIGRVWKPVILSFLFLVATAIPLAIVGTCTCGLGIPFVGALMGMAQAHLQWQVYEEYLRAGGEPIPIKEEVSEV